MQSDLGAVTSSPGVLMESPRRVTEYLLPRQEDRPDGGVQASHKHSTPRRSRLEPCFGQIEQSSDVF